MGMDSPLLLSPWATYKEATSHIEEYQLANLRYRVIELYVLAAEGSARETHHNHNTLMKYQW